MTGWFQPDLGHILKDALDVVGAVHAGELRLRRLGRIPSFQRFEAVAIKRVQHRAQSIRPLRMARAGVVIKAVGVGEQQRFHSNSLSISTTGG